MAGLGVLSRRVAAKPFVTSHILMPILMVNRPEPADIVPGEMNLQSACTTFVRKRLNATIG